MIVVLANVCIWARAREAVILTPTETQCILLHSTSSTCTNYFCCATKQHENTFCGYAVNVWVRENKEVLKVGKEGMSGSRSLLPYMGQQLVRKHNVTRICHSEARYWLLYYALAYVSLVWRSVLCTYFLDFWGYHESHPHCTRFKPFKIARPH